MISRPCSSIPSGSGTIAKPVARRWRSSAWIVGVHGPDARRTVSPTRTTAVMLPPARTTSSMCAPYRRESRAMNEPDVIIVGAGLAGLVAAHELVKAGRRGVIVEQEDRNNLGAQAFWSLGGLFYVDSPEQRRMGIKDSYELALQDWMGSAAFDREREDFWPRQWAEAYVRFAATEKRRYLFDLGLRVVPTVGWAERGGGDALGHGNSVPRFHLTWGTGPELVRIFAEPALAGEQRGLVSFAFRHRVDELIVEDGAVAGVRGSVLEPCDALQRGRESSRNGVGEFELRAPAGI